MIVMKLCLDKIYGFEDFQLDLSYPKKVVNSIIDGEHLADRERFRYKKAVVLMGANATGKTCLGKALRRIFAFIESGNPSVLCEMTSGAGASFTLDCVNEGTMLHRLAVALKNSQTEPEIRYSAAQIAKNDSYEMAAAKLIDRTDEATRAPLALRKLIGRVAARFAWPEIETSPRLSGADKTTLLKTLRAVVGTLDPTLKDISVSRDLKDSFIIRRKNAEIIIQDGRVLNSEQLSSGTAEGVDVAVFLASMMRGGPCFYYLDEHFSFIHSDIERRVFGLMLDRLAGNSQLIFTTHNSDMLDLNLPKHAFVFLRRDGDGKITALSASELLKRNTDSVRSAAENDVFGAAPDDSPLDELETVWTDA